MRNTPNPRRRDRRVLVEVLTTTKAKNGEPIEAWGPAFTGEEGEPLDLWAEKLEGRALERFAAAQRIAETAAVFVFAWSPASVIDPATHRLKYAGRTYEVHGATEVGRRQGVAVTCMAVANPAEGTAPPL